MSKINSKIAVIQYVNYEENVDMLNPLFKAEDLERLLQTDRDILRVRIVTTTDGIAIDQVIPGLATIINTVGAVRDTVNVKTPLAVRGWRLFDALEAIGCYVRLSPKDEQPAKGRAFYTRVLPRKRVVRINYRCGYGPRNYAPCVEIPFSTFLIPA